MSIHRKHKCDSFARAIYLSNKEGSGYKCPFGCKGSAALWWGLVRHLMERHGKTQAEAEALVNAA